MFQSAASLIKLIVMHSEDKKQFISWDKKVIKGAQEHNYAVFPVKFEH